MVRSELTLALLTCSLRPRLPCPSFTPTPPPPHVPAPFNSPSFLPVRLNLLGYRVGARLLELLPLRDSLHPLSSLRSPPPPSRTLRLLPLLSYIHSPLYRYLFGRPADSLEQSTENPDEYMIGDDDMLVTRSVVVPQDMKELSCGAIVAGIVEGVMDGAGFVSPSSLSAKGHGTSHDPSRLRHFG